MPDDQEAHHPSDPAADAEAVADAIAPATDQPDDEMIRQMAADKMVQAELDGPENREGLAPPPEKPETAEDDDEEQKDPADAKADEKKPAEEEGEPDDKPADGETPKHWRARQARKYKLQGDALLTEAKQVLGEAERSKVALEQQAADLAPFRAIAEKARHGDVEAAIDALARHVGMQPHDILERYVRRKAGEPDEPRRGPSPEIEEMRQEMKAMREELRQEREQAQRAAQAAQHQQQLGAAIDECMAVQSDDRLKRLWPHAAALPAAYLRKQVSAMAPSALQSGTPAALDDMMAAIDEQAKLLQDHYQVHGETGGGGNGAAKTGSGRGSPAQAKADNAPQLSNESAAAATSGRRAKTQAEIDAQVDAIAAQAAEDYMNS